jgi:hypothetical protein
MDVINIRARSISRRSAPVFNFNGKMPVVMLVKLAVASSLIISPKRRTSVEDLLLFGLSQKAFCDHLPHRRIAYFATSY